MKTTQNLLNATSNKKAGSHRVEFSTNRLGHTIREFYYYSTVICLVNDNKRIFSIDDTYGTSSTTRACNAYRRELESTHKEITL